MKIVADTNAVASAYLWHGVPAQVLDLHAGGWIEICTCVEQLAELAAVLQRPKFMQRLAAARLTPSEVVAHFSQLKEVVVPTPIAPTTVPDRKDLWVLGCALSGRVDAIVTGDKHLLNLRNHAGIPIHRPAKFLACFAFTKEK